MLAGGDLGDGALALGQHGDARLKLRFTAGERLLPHRGMLGGPLQEFAALRKLALTRGLFGLELGCFEELLGLDVGGLTQ